MRGGGPGTEPALVARPGASEPSPREWNLPGGHLLLWTGALPAERADRLLAVLWHDLQWSRHHVRIAGRRLPCPRLSAWYGVPGARYAYSGESHAPLPFGRALSGIRDEVEHLTGRRFNSVLANAYRHGGDSMGWHSDDEPELGARPAIASLSLGATRRFRLRHRDGGADPVSLDLGHGSLLVMDGETQSHWQHAVPKTRRPVGLRLNLTFRWIEIAGTDGPPFRLPRRPAASRGFTAG